MATMTDIARECGVSTSTVSLVINRKGRISPDTRNKILDTMNRLGYDLEAKRAIPRAERTSTIGLVLPRPVNVDDEFYYRAVSAVFGTTLEYGYDSKIFSQEDLRRRVTDDFYKGKEQLGCDGLLLFGPSEGWEGMLDNLKAWDLPVTVIRRTVDREGVVCFTDDDYKGARLAVEYLADAGHTVIATLMRPQYASSGISKLRRQAWHDVLTERGLTTDPRLNIDHNTNPVELADHFHHLEKAGLKVTAVTAIDDQLANRLVIALQQSGRRVPEDVAVIGYDDDPIAENRYPRLTTVRMPVEDMVAAACRTLVRWMPENNETQAVMKFKNELIVRESTGTARNADRVKA